ncbi:hypothetical protein KP509_38G067800 [Ceratopteris richardii]|uniref:RRM domain-containing protein n=1 Tax=Ceratopteris richardii TaxID=49495 RepID=A0A8T2Q5J2_CERRI|nr:hypothetical protein KP509_38G067800 [Ceratopteris richardii]
MACACFSSLNGSLAPATTTRPNLRLTLSQAPRGLQCLRPFDHATVSLSIPRTIYCSRRGFAVVGQAQAELSVGEVQDAEDEDFESGPLEASTDGDVSEEASDSDASPYADSGFKLYVGNLPWSCNSEELAGVFQKVGSVDMVEVIYDRESGRSRGFGFVTMSSLEDCNNAIEKLNGADYAGRTLRVNFPIRNRGEAPPPRPPREQNNVNKLFVGNLSWAIDDATLERLFSEYGTVLEARVINDRETGRSRGFGFVTMSNEDEVNEALNKMDGTVVEGRNLRVNMAGERPASRGDFF